MIDIIVVIGLFLTLFFLFLRGVFMKTAVLWAAGGTGFTFLMTALGSALVFFFRKGIKSGVQRIFLGFAAGVMISASMFGLLVPAIETAEAAGQAGWIPAAGGFLIGVGFLLLLDQLMPHLHIGESRPEGVSSSFKRTTLLMLAVTLHNIPEGMAAGLAFAMAANSGGDYASAIILAIGIGIQNFPEGAAISLPLRKEGFSAKKAFVFGCISGVVEPIFGVLMVLLSSYLAPLMPWFLSFAAGAMMYVVVEELIPETHIGEHSNLGTIGVMAGFIIMMVLDVALG